MLQQLRLMFQLGVHVSPRFNCRAWGLGYRALGLRVEGQRGGMSTGGPAASTVSKAAKVELLAKKRALAAAALQRIPPVRIPDILQTRIDELITDHPDVNISKATARLESIKTFWEDEELGSSRHLRKLHSITKHNPRINPQTLATDQGPIKYAMEDAVSYVSTRMASAYTAHYRVFSEIKRRIPHFRPRQILDFGSGPGTSLWAIRELWPETLQRAYLIETSQPMTRICSRLIEGVDSMPLTKNLPLIPNVGRRVPDKELANDLVICAFSMGELASMAHRMAVVKYLWSLTCDMLVIIEPATLHGSALVRRLRDRVLTSENKRVRTQYRGLYLPVTKGHVIKGLGVHVVAPCAHDGGCPMSKKKEGGVCALVQAMESNSGLDKDKSKKESFSFVVMRRGFRPWLHWPLDKYKDVTSSEEPPQPIPEQDQAADLGGGWMRIVNSPSKLGNGITIPVCMPVGRNARAACLEDIKIMKSEDLALYSLANDVQWGDLWPR